MVYAVYVRKIQTAYALIYILNSLKKQKKMAIKTNLLKLHLKFGREKKREKIGLSFFFFTSFCACLMVSLLYVYMIYTCAVR